MGSFNVACSISNLSLNCGDPAVYIPLEVHEYPGGIGDGDHTLIYPHCFYSPVTLPLFGKYDDYGRLDLEEDDNLNLVIDFFKISDKDDIFNFKVKEFKSGMFIHRKIFDVLSSIYYNDWSGKKDTGDNREECSYESQREYLKEAIEDEVQSKELWKDFDWESTSEAMKEVYKEDPSIGKFFKMYTYWERAAIRGKSYFCYDEYKTFNTVYQPQILEGKFKKELTLFNAFKRGMFGTNTFFFPAMNGCQFGNPFMSKLLYETALKISKETIKKQKEDVV